MRHEYLPDNFNLSGQEKKKGAGGELYGKEKKEGEERTLIYQ